MGGGDGYAVRDALKHRLARDAFKHRSIEKVVMRDIDQFAPPSYCQMPNIFNASSQHQASLPFPIPLTRAGGLWLSSRPLVHTLQQNGPQTSAANVSSMTQQSSSDWQEYMALDGRKFYYNKIRRQSSWEKPLELMTRIERADASTVWKEFTTADGRKYYYNKVTKQSTWTIPEDLKMAREQAEKEAAEGTQSDINTITSAVASVTISPVEQ